MAKKLYEETNIQAIADAIRAKNGSTDTYKTSDMAAAISAIEGGGGGGDMPAKALILSGDCRYKFYGGGWDWFVETYGDRITTKDLTLIMYMFNYSDLQTIPFELNFPSNMTASKSLNYLFSSCNHLTSIPKINNGVPESTHRMFENCYRLREIPKDIASWFDWSAMRAMTSTYQGDMGYMFDSCYSLRSVPSDFFSYANPNAGYSYSYFSNAFNNCYVLDELIDLPIPYTATWTSNGLARCFDNCKRLKNITFEMPDGQPYVKNWKGQTIDLTSVGFSSSKTTTQFVNYNSGITEDKMAWNDETYQALKDDPDHWAAYSEYSRYNLASAVATIQSLPDTSAYLATAGGTNTIKFKGAAGSKTDGGAINTMSEETIALAASKGWTVTFV